MANTKTDPTTVLEHALARCQDHLVADSRVLGLCIFGSLASGEADAFSDIDLGILVAQPQIDSILTDRDIICAPAPPLVTGLASSDPRCVYALYEVADQIVKVDYNYFSDEHVPPWLSGETHVLFDRSNALPRLISLASARPEPRAASSHAFSVEIWSAVRMLSRGELFEACDIVNHLRDPLLTRLLSEAYAVPFRNYRHLEALYPAELVEQLRQTFAGPIPEELTRAIAHLADIYLHTVDLAGSDSRKQDAAAIRHILRRAAIPPVSHGDNT